MNARSHTFELVVEERQIPEAVLSIFHTILFHRTLGKFHYKQEGSYSIGTLGMTDVDCDFIHFTYVRVSSEELDKLLKKEVTNLREEMARRGDCNRASISLEFLQRKKSALFRNAEFPWEVWTVSLNVVHLNNQNERRQMSEELGEALMEKMLVVTDTMGRFEYVPKVPPSQDLELVFDCSFPDVQPYLFKLNTQFNTYPVPSQSVGFNVKKLIKGALAF